MREGHCHKCKKWIALDTVKKDVDVNVSYASCPTRAVLWTDESRR
jgi:hypothetical protein